LNNSHQFKILIVNDGSSDTAKKLGATIISLGKQYGVGFAITKKYDIVVIIAGNNKDNPQEIYRLLKPITREGYDFIQGSRFLKGGKYGNMPIYRILATKLHSLLFLIFSRKWITESTNGFKAFKTSIFKDKRLIIYQKWLDKYELEPYLYFKLI